MLPELEENAQITQQDEFSEQFLNEYIQNLRRKIQTRKSIEEFLFFVACQIASASMALILFKFAVNVFFTTWICQVIGWIPSLSSLGEVHFKKTRDGWTVEIMNKPVTTIIKFISSVGIVAFTIYQVQQEILYTHQQIHEVYAEIQQYESPKIEHFLPPYAVEILISAVAIVGLISFLQFLRNRTPF